MTGELISSGIISSSEEIIMSADNINAFRTEGHEILITKYMKTICVRKLFLIISKVVILGRNKLKIMFLYHNEILL